jgi:hypothetical protein
MYEEGEIEVYQCCAGSRKGLEVNEEGSEFSIGHSGTKGRERDGRRGYFLSCRVEIDLNIWTGAL